MALPGLPKGVEKVKKRITNKNGVVTWEGYDKDNPKDMAELKRKVAKILAEGHRKYDYARKEILKQIKHKKGNVISELVLARSCGLPVNTAIVYSVNGKYSVTDVQYGGSVAHIVDNVEHEEVNIALDKLKHISKQANRALDAMAEREDATNITYENKDLEEDTEEAQKLVFIEKLARLT